MSQIDKGDVSRILPVDIAGAFNRVSHAGLLHKLRIQGVGGNLLKWIGSYLEDRQLAAVVGGRRSSLFPIRAGVPQGRILGPLLFLLYVNDLEDNLPQAVKLAVYSDDTTIYINIDCESDVATQCAIFQSGVDSLFAWGRGWKISFEPSKSQAMIVSNKRRPWSIEPVQFGGINVEEVSEMRILGVSIDTKLTFKSYILNCAKRARQRLSMMSRATRIVDRSGLATIYKGFVRPVMESGSIVWSGAAATNLQFLDRVQHRATRMLGQDIPLDSLSHRRKVGCLSYLYKLKCCDVKSRVQDILPPMGVRRDTGYGTRFQARRGSPHPFQLQSTLSRRSLNLAKRSFPNVAIDDWNSLPELMFRKGIERSGLQKFKCEVNSMFRG